MLNIQNNFSLKKLNTFKIESKAKYFVRVKNREDLKRALNFAREKRVSIFILGGGSNIIFPDGIYNGIIIKIENEELKFLKGEKVFVGAGFNFLKLILKCKEKNLSGLEWGAGIPGTIGGAIFGNAGAFGGEIKDNIEKVFVIDKNTLKERIFNRKDCQFSYRNSIFKKKKKYIIWSAVLRLKKKKKREIENSIKEKIIYRQKNHPLKLPSAGSIFKSIPLGYFKKEIIKKYPEILSFKEKKEVPAGFLIEKCGLGGKRIGGAQVSQKHKNFIVNIKNAKAKDIISLINFIKGKVKQKFKIDLEEEVIIV